MSRASDSGGRERQAVRAELTGAQCTLRAWIAGSCDDEAHAAMTARVLADEALRAQARTMLRGPDHADFHVRVAYRRWRLRWPADCWQPLWSCRAPHRGRGEALVVEQNAEGTLRSRLASGAEIECFGREPEIVLLEDPLLHAFGQIRIDLKALAEHGTDALDAVVEAAEQLAGDGALDDQADAAVELMRGLVAALNPAGQRDAIDAAHAAVASDGTLDEATQDRLIALVRARIVLEAAAEVVLDDAVDDALLDLDAAYDDAGIDLALAAVDLCRFGPGPEREGDQTWWQRAGSTLLAGDATSEAIRSALLGLAERQVEVLAEPPPFAFDATVGDVGVERAASTFGRDEHRTSNVIDWVPRYPVALAGALGSSERGAYETLRWKRPRGRGSAIMRGYSPALPAEQELEVVVHGVAVKAIGLCGIWRDVSPTSGDRRCAKITAHELVNAPASGAGLDHLMVRREDGVVEVWLITD